MLSARHRTGSRRRRNRPFRTPQGSDGVDAGGGRAGDYSAAAAAHTFEEFLECRLSQEAFSDWLQRYSSTAAGSADPAVEDEINRALLALRAWRKGTRSWPEVERGLIAARSRLTGLAWC